MQVLIVEDEPKLAQALKQGLEAEHYECKVAATGEEGFFLVNTETFDLMILDLMLPGRDGLEALVALRRRGLSTPVLILSARDTVTDRIRGLDAGADDYLVKPFAFPELLARLRALIRRGRADEILRFKVADLSLADYGRTEITLAGARSQAGGGGPEFGAPRAKVRGGGRAAPPRRGPGAHARGLGAAEGAGRGVFAW